MDMERDQKKQRRAAVDSPHQHKEHAFDITSPLASLSPDALISVLCRVPACDHMALRNTCRCLRETIDSDAFASERGATGWAEVTARHVTKEELYDRLYPNGPELWGDDDSYDPKEEISRDLTEEERAKQEARKKRWEAKREAKRREDLETYYSDLGSRDESYGYDDITVDIKVDGVKAGEVDFVRIPRPRYGTLFHEATDAHSGELQQVGWTLCHRNGRPKVRSIKEANVDGRAKMGGFLHINKVRIRRAYRSMDNTNVVARAVRAALTVPELEGMWTLATAICDSNVYMTREDKKREREMENYWHGNQNFDSTTDENIEARTEEEEKFYERFDQLIELDARTLLRVGYKQIPEVVDTRKNQPAWLFALPHYLGDPILSHEEAVAIKLIGPPVHLPPDPKGVDKELFDLVKRFCNNHKYALASLEGVDRELSILEQKTRETWDGEVEIIERFQGVEAQVAEAERMLEEDSHNIPEEVRARLERNSAEARPEMDVVRGALELIKRKHDTVTFEEWFAVEAREVQGKKEQLLEQKSKNDKDFKAKVTALVNDKGASIRNSFVLHCSARFLLPEYVDFLLKLVPAHQRTAAVNDLDTNGCTPLHCLLMGTPEMSNADSYYGAVEHLLGLGARKDIVDTSGRTPLGQYRSVRRERIDYEDALLDSNTTEESLRQFHQRMEVALMPMGGETEADREASAEQSNESSDDAMDFFDDSDDDIDIDDDDDIDDDNNIDDEDDADEIDGEDEIDGDL